MEVELARPLSFEPPGLEFDDKMGMNADVIEAQVDVKGLASDLKRELAADKRKAATELQ